MVDIYLINKNVNNINISSSITLSLSLLKWVGINVNSWVLPKVGTVH